MATFTGSILQKNIAKGKWQKKEGASDWSPEAHLKWLGKARALKSWAGGTVAWENPELLLWELGSWEMKMKEN